MSIQEIFSNFKQLSKNPEARTAGLLVAVALASYGVGTVSETSDVGHQIPAEERATLAESFIRTPDTASVTPSLETPEESPKPLPAVPLDGGYVASKNGTKYHLPWCSGAKRIKEENKVWFGTKAEAEAAGYTPAANCKGI